MSTCASGSLGGDTGLLVPAPDDLLLATPASKRVNTAGNEGPGCWVDDGARDDERLREALEQFPRAMTSTQQPAWLSRYACASPGHSWG